MRDRGRQAGSDALTRADRPAKGARRTPDELVRLIQGPGAAACFGRPSTPCRDCYELVCRRSVRPAKPDLAGQPQFLDRPEVTARPWLRAARRTSASGHQVRSTPPPTADRLALIAGCPPPDAPSVSTSPSEWMRETSAPEAYGRTTRTSVSGCGTSSSSVGKGHPARHAARPVADRVSGRGGFLVR